MPCLYAAGLSLCGHYIEACRFKLNSNSSERISVVSKLQWKASMSAYSFAIGRSTSRFLLRRLRALRSKSESPYSPVASLALLLAVGILVKFH